MIGLILGTSEGREILSLLNNFTDDIFISTATEYGGEILKDYKYKYLNTTPLTLEELTRTLKEKGVKVLVDASHPYALEITKNSIKVCETLGIEYIRYERPSCAEKYRNEENVVTVRNYNELHEKIKHIEGNILNTTGSRNLDKILAMKLKNRIVHRVLPSVKVMQECFEYGIAVDNIVAIKGPIGYDLNCAFIKEYNAKAMILKDSGVQGGTEEKLKACIDNNIWAFIIDRQEKIYNNSFNDVELLVKYLYNSYK
ncbi:cobalt-precorrin-6A reductase [Clostridium sp. DJ247]|uniref:cobalt-precorrin-6A reductase n=1 Tax=Clostridium sp. DJ247 TaxID=2726188 RepID=UPI0016284803|nr:cobalt-precorrin-6A reductase [Clostridium sp. DJ247]MBC2582196.1 cobalt-precorrin-6A reductase [Clostridium sp. DJ247]